MNYIILRGFVMADNFDTNIANRKPNVSRKNRPVHPWDVKELPSDTNDVSLENIKDSGSKKPSLKPDIKPEPSTVKKKAKRTINTPLNALNIGISEKAGDLSNSINIHSNFCKLDNDVSDHLFSRLSASAQSVYLRLYRQSFGWNRNWAAESLPKLTKACNLSLQTIRKAIKELETIGCIRKEFSDYHKATVYRIFLPSEINLVTIRNTKYAGTIKGGLNNNSQLPDEQILTSQNSDYDITSAQNKDSGNYNKLDLKNLEGERDINRGQDINIQSIYFSGTSIYALLESGGSLPKNISKYITDKHLMSAVSTIDEFYDSIGFSIVSRAVYRKSLIDYFDLIKSGFSHDDIRYAVRWTFKNSRSRPESFSLIKYTMHMAMNDFIGELKNVSGEKELAQKKKELLDKNIEWENRDKSKNVSSDDLKLWVEVVENLKSNLNDQSFKAFIEPLKLLAVEDDSVTIGAPPDSVSWIVDHYLGIIEETFREKTGNKMLVKIE